LKLYFFYVKIRRFALTVTKINIFLIKTCIEEEY